MTHYSIAVESDISHIGIVPNLPGGSTDSVTVNGVDATAGTAVGVEPPVGSSETSVVVASASGTRTTYTIAVRRDDIGPVVDKFLKLSFSDPATKVTMGYRLFVPDGYDPKRSYPLVLFLRGAGERGTDNEIQLTANRGATAWATPEKQAKHAAFVLAPQSNGKPDSTTGWTSFMADDRFHPSARAASPAAMPVAIGANTGGRRTRTIGRFVHGNRLGERRRTTTREL